MSRGSGSKALAGCVLGLLLAAGAPGPALAEPPVDEDYLLHCSACHGMDGAGTPVTPGLVGIGWLLDAPGGRAYLARVPGVAQAPLSDARLARLLNWTLARYAGRPPEPAYTASEVGELRRAPLRDPLSARPLPGPDQR